MEQWAWQELQAQVKDHGHGSVQFYLANSGESPEDYLDLVITDIKFEDGEIRIELE